MTQEVPVLLTYTVYLLFTVFSTCTMHKENHIDLRASKYTACMRLQAASMPCISICMCLCTYTFKGTCTTPASRVSHSSAFINYVPHLGRGPNIFMGVLIFQQKLIYSSWWSIFFGKFWTRGSYTVKVLITAPP